VAELEGTATVVGAGNPPAGYVAPPVGVGVADDEFGLVMAAPAFAGRALPVTGLPGAVAAGLLVVAAALAAGAAVEIAAGLCAATPVAAGPAGAAAPGCSIRAAPTPRIVPAAAHAARVAQRRRVAVPPGSAAPSPDCRAHAGRTSVGAPSSGALCVAIRPPFASDV
jgi:hypothetical protein